VQECLVSKAEIKPYKHHGPLKATTNSIMEYLQRFIGLISRLVILASANYVIYGVNYRSKEVRQLSNTSIKIKKKIFFHPQPSSTRLFL